jgi:hypothetical protein
MNDNNPKPDIAIWPTDEGEIRIRSENGATLYVGFWQGMKTVWGLIHKGHKVEVKE